MPQSAGQRGAAAKDSPTLGIQVATGSVGGWASVNKFGRNTDVDTGGDNREDIWDGGSSWQAPTGSSLLEVWSASANDSAAGTGAQTVTLQGLDSAGALSSETVSLAGATRVPTTSSFSMVHRLFTATAGSSGVNTGLVSVTNPTDTTVTMAAMSSGNNQSLMAIYRVPDNKSAAMTSYYATLNKSAGGPTNANVSIRLLVQSSVGGVWRLQHEQGLSQAAESAINHSFDPPLTVSSLATIRVEAETDTSNCDIAAGFDLYLRDV